MAKSGATTGTLAGTIIGGVIGAILAYPTGGLSLYAGLSLGAAIGGTVGGVAGTLFDTTTADDTLREQQGLADLSIQTSTYGAIIPQVFGSYGGIAGNVIWSTLKIEHEHRQEESASAKGGGPKVVTVTRTYTVSMAIGICDTRVTGPVAYLGGISRDLTPFWYGAPGKALPEGWTFYSGAPDQMPDPTIEAAMGVGNVPAFRHLCYVVIKDDDLGMSGRTYNYTFHVATDAAGALAFGAMRVQPGTGRPWLNMRPANEVWWLDAASQAVLGTTRVSGPELLGGFSGTTDAQLAVSAERAWATMGAYLFELDGASGAVLSSYHFEEHAVADFLTFKDYPYGPIVERGGVAIVLAQCLAGIADFSSRYDVDIVQMARGGGITTRRVSDRSPTWLEAAPDGTLWALLHRVDTTPGAAGTREQVLYHLDPATLGSISETTVATGMLQTFHVAPDGRIWVPLYLESKVRRCTTGGGVDAEQTLAEFPFQCTTASDGSLWVFCQGTPPEQPTTQGHLFKLDPDSLAILLHVRVDPTFLHLGALGGASALDPQLIAGEDGSVWCTSRVSHTLSHVSATGAVTTFATLAVPMTVQASLTPGEVWVSSLDGGVQRFHSAGVIQAPASASSRGGLAGVVRDLCQAAGLGPAQVALDGLPAGQVEMALVSMQAVRAPLQELAQAFRFYAVETGGRLAFRSIGSGGIVAELPEGDLDAAENVSPGAGLQVQRLDTQQLPTTLDVTYSDARENYQSNTQRHMLGVGTDEVEAPRTLSVGLSLSAVQAKQVSQEVLSSLWVQRESFRTQVSRKYAALEPGDRVTITARGLTYPVVVTQTGYGRPGLLELQGVQDAAYVRGAVGAAPPVVIEAPPVVPVVQPTLALMLNLPALHGADTTPRAHVAFVATAPGWSGAVLYRSRDGETYELVLSSSLEAWTGIVGAGTPAADWHVCDDTTTITVVMRSAEMQLRSVSEAALLGGANRCVLGPEILAFGQATLVAPLTYTLTHLLRGLRGTEHLVDTHGSNERLMMLDQAVHAVPILPGEMNSPRLYKVVSVGQTIDLVEPFSFTATAPNLYPWDVAQPQAVRQPSGDWLLTWQMRSRFAAEWMQHADSPMAFDTDFRNFRVDILGGTDVVRSVQVDGGTPMQSETLKQWTYTVADQTADFGSAQTTLDYRIYQVTNTGVGFAYTLRA